MFFFFLFHTSQQLKPEAYWLLSACSLLVYPEDISPLKRGWKCPGYRRC